MTVVTRSLLALAAWSSIVSAAPASQAGAAAEAQFDKAVELKKAGNWKDACTAFEASQKLDPQLGTLYNVAECNEHLAKLATAWFAYREVAQRDTNTKRRDRARGAAHALEPRLSKLTVTVAPPVAGASVTMNGGDITQLLGIETPVDAGTYDIAAMAPGYAPWHSQIPVTDEGKTVTVAIALQRPAHETKPPVVGATPVVPEPTKPESGETVPARHRSHRTAWGIGVTSLGGALAIGGFVFGALAHSSWSSATALCPGQACASPGDLAQANSLGNTATTRGTISDLLLAAGAVAVGTGVYLLVSSRHHRDDRAALRLAPSAGGITLSGGF